MILPFPFSCCLPFAALLEVLLALVVEGDGTTLAAGAVAVLLGILRAAGRGILTVIVFTFDLGGEGARPTDGVILSVVVLEAFSRGFLNMEMRQRLYHRLVVWKMQAAVVNLLMLTSILICM